jgi:hypothetical protein
VDPRGISVIGDINWHDHGVETERVTQSGTCTDTTQLGSGDISLERVGSEMAASYFPGVSLRTRCPGPMLGSDGLLATETIPAAAFSHRVTRIDLQAGPGFRDDGYVTRPEGHISVGVRRSGKPKQHVFKVPAGLASLFGS